MSIKFPLRRTSATTIVLTVVLFVLLSLGVLLDYMRAASVCSYAEYSHHLVFGWTHCIRAEMTAPWAV
jgi:hypothetical protein